MFKITHYYPTFALNEYQRLMLLYTKSLKRFLVNILLSDEFINAYKSVVKQDSLVDILSRLKTSINNYVSNAKISFTNSIANIATKVTNFVTNKMKEKISDFRSSDNLRDKINLWILENQYLLSTFAEKFYERILNSISQAITAVDSYSTLRTYCGRVLEGMIKRAKMVAGSQISKLNLLIVKTLNKVNGFDFYKWLTQGDDKVRHSHAVLDGKYCKWDDATTYKNSLTDKKWRSRSSIGGVSKDVGEDFNCRCFSIGVSL